MFDASTGGFYTLPMPELPEVETVRSAMECHLLGRPIARVRVSTKRLREPLPRAALRSLVGDCFAAARRRAKFLLLDLAIGPDALGPSRHERQPAPAIVGHQARPRGL